MAQKKMTIVWSRDASKNFLEIITYLSEKSSTAVNIVGNSILDEIELLPTRPLIFEADKLKRNNNGNFRAFIIYSYRVSYFIDKTNHEIFIISIRHTSREPKEY